MNFAAPLIDTYTQPRTYGHKKANRGMPAKPDASAADTSSKEG